MRCDIFPAYRQFAFHDIRPKSGVTFQLSPDIKTGARRFVYHRDLWFTLDTCFCFIHKTMASVKFYFQQMKKKLINLNKDTEEKKNIVL